MSNTPETDRLAEEFKRNTLPDDVKLDILFGFTRKLECALDEFEQERDEARRESLEQARLLGISGEWGCRLIAKREEAKAIAKEAIAGLYNLGDYDLANRLTSKLEETK
jgi:hypothetical protein